EVRSIGRAEADAAALVAGGGGVQVGVAYATSTIEPKVYAFIGSQSTIQADGNVTVSAELPQQQAGDTKLHHDTVNVADDPVTGNTLRYDNHGLATGDVVRYSLDSNQTTV